MAEVMDAASAADKYQSGIALIAGSDGHAYNDCGAKRLSGGVKAVAECMKGLKKTAGLPVWAEKYRRAYEGR
jgi:hypothetical protein